MNNYERKVFADLQLWQKEMQEPPGLMNKLSKGIQTKMNNMLPEKFHETVTNVIKQMIKGVLFGSEKISLETRKLTDLELTEKAVEKSIKLYKNTAAAEGGITGAGGFLASLADFPLLVSIKIKMLYDIAAKYGFDLNDYKERIYLLHIFELAFSSDSKRNLVYEKMKNWKTYKNTLPENINDFDWRNFQQEYRDYIDLAKIAQMIPLIGAAVGLVVNYRLLKKLGATAMQAYRMRIFDESRLQPTGVTNIFVE